MLRGLAVKFNLDCTEIGLDVKNRLFRQICNGLHNFFCFLGLLSRLY